MADTNETTAEHILVVDDEPSICRMVAKVLKSEGYEPIICTHPREALTVAERETFNFAFIDIKLPEMNGLDLAEKLKDLNPLLEVVFMTGYGTIENAVQAIKVGAYDFLRKPFNINELKLCLNRFREREALKKEIRLVERRHFHLVQHIPLVIFVLRKDLQLDFINEACSAMLGYSPDEALAVPNWFVERICSEDRERIKSLLNSAFTSEGSPFSTECRFIHKRGNLLHTIIKSIPWLEHEAEAEAERLEGIIVDITDRIFLEKALIQKEKLKTLGAISAEVAHEIRNPLVSLGGFARRLQKKFPDVPEIGIILSESHRLEKILDRIKNYLKPVEIRPRECSVNKIITDCVDLLSPELERKQVVYRTDLDPQLPDVCVDPDILSEIVIILIRKTGEISDKGKTVVIRSFESNQNLHIEFKGQAVAGTKIKDVEHLFLPFDEGGQSIGLPLSYRLLKNMGGFLSFAQDDNDVIFTVTLPKKISENTPGELSADPEAAVCSPEGSSFTSH